MLHFILGPSGSGKSYQMLAELRTRAERGERSILIVPEQFTSSTEGVLYRTLGDSLSAYVESYSFTSLSEALLRRYGGAAVPTLTEAGRALLLRRQRELVQILTDPAFAAHYRILGEDYKRIEIPEELHPALHDLYRKKSFYVEHNDGLDPRISRPEYAQEIGAGMLLLKPLYQLLTNEYGDFAE